MHRRKFLHGLAGATLSGLAGEPVSAFERRSLASLAAAMASGRESVEALAERLIERNRRLEDLGAFIAFDPALLLAQARTADRLRQDGKRLGPLHGIPVGIKDNIDTAMLPTTGGTPTLRNHRPRVAAPAVQNLLQAGALVGGKTNLHELAGGGTTNNPSFVRTANPYRPEHIPGGSSGGSAVAVAAGLMPCALGTDTAGSVRIPASYCGVVGFRPSTGRVSMKGVIPFALTRDTVGPLAGSVEDVALLDSLLAGEVARPLPEIPARTLRLGVPSKPYLDNLSRGVARRFEQVLKDLDRAGVRLIEAEIPDLVAMHDGMTLLKTGIELRRDLPIYLRESGAEVTIEALIDNIADPFVKPFFQAFRDPDAAMWAEYERLMREVLPTMRRAYRAYLERHAVQGIVYPTTPVTAGIEVAGTADVIVEGKRIRDGIWLNIQNTSPTTLWACGGISVPAGLDDTGLPIGLGIDGWPGKDRELLAVARAVERVLPETPAPPIV